jgi:chromate reductase
MDVRKIAVIVGSLRKESISRATARALMAVAPESLRLEILEIGGLPMYNQDLEESLPPPWREFRERLRTFDGFLFVTPEHNRSIPAVLKNAIDVGSRPSGQNAWNGKPGAVVSVTTGALGAFGANHHLRQSLVFVNVPVMAQPEAYIGGAQKLLDERGALVSEPTREFLRKFMAQFAIWVERNSAG